MTQQLKRYSIVVNPNDMDNLDLIAKENEISRSLVIRMAIKKYLKERKNLTDPDKEKRDNGEEYK